jgi:hypothetical protein
MGMQRISFLFFSKWPKCMQQSTNSQGKPYYKNNLTLREKNSTKRKEEGKK